MSKDEKKWRAEKGETYWVAHADFSVCRHREDNLKGDTDYYDNNNYFRTREEAKAAAEDIRKVFMRHAGEMHDFEWAMKQLLAKKIVRRKSWSHPLASMRMDKGQAYIYYATGGIYPLLIRDYLATDWEIYQGE